MGGRAGRDRQGREVLGRGGEEGEGSREEVERREEDRGGGSLGVEGRGEEDGVRVEKQRRERGERSRSRKGGGERERKWERREARCSLIPLAQIYFLVICNH